MIKKSNVFHVLLIKNGIMLKNICRELLGLEKNKKYILFSAFNGIQDTRKGFDLLVEALKSLNISTKDYSILILGNSDGIDKYKSILL